MSVLYVGDLHGFVDHTARIDQKATALGVEAVVQVGDFGIRFGGGECGMHKYFAKRAKKNPDAPTWYTCGGNHDNWTRWMAWERGTNIYPLTELAPLVYYVSRGESVLIGSKLHLFLGGAESTDKDWRTPEKTWWATESPNRQELDKFAENLNAQKPDVVVTHDAPQLVNISRSYVRYNMPTSRLLDGIYENAEHVPERWLYGHHHQLKQEEHVRGLPRGDVSYSTTDFYCCGFHGEAWLVDGDTVQKIKV